MAGIKVKIDLSKVDKSQLFKGEKGTYLDIVLWDKTDDRFGNDFMVVQDISKDARDKGQKGPILGNAKWLGGGGGNSARQSRPQAESYADGTPRTQKPGEQPAQNSVNEDIPF